MGTKVLHGWGSKKPSAVRCALQNVEQETPFSAYLSLKNSRFIRLKEA